MIKVSKDNNLSVRLPEIAKEWHPTKNKDSTPEKVTPKSSKMVRWQCTKKGHEWDATIANRTYNDSGCPYCGGKKADKDNNLFVLFPNIAKQWHPTLNGNSKPEGVLPGSGQKVWWKCPKGDDHDYDATIHNRTYNGSGCPKCTNQTSEPELRILTELQFIFDGVIHRHKIEGHEVDHEGYVMENGFGTFKLVDRETFSYHNFNLAKSW